MTLAKRDMNTAIEMAQSNNELIQLANDGQLARAVFLRQGDLEAAHNLSISIIKARYTIGRTIPMTHAEAGAKAVVTPGDNFEGKMTKAQRQFVYRMRQFYGDHEEDEFPLSWEEIEEIANRTVAPDVHMVEKRIQEARRTARIQRQNKVDYEIKKDEIENQQPDEQPKPDIKEKTGIVYDRECSSLPLMGRFPTVVIDPPWATMGGSRASWAGDAAPDYYKEQHLMDINDIKRMPIPEILTEDAFVFLWTTSPHLPDALECLDCWGLRYVYMMVWHKPGGAKPTNYPTYNAEFIVVGVSGAPLIHDTAGFRLVNQWNRTEHSAKPAEFYQLIAERTDEPRLDIFNRRIIPRFIGWGNESPYPLDTLGHGMV